VERNFHVLRSSTICKRCGRNINAKRVTKRKASCTICVTMPLLDRTGGLGIEWQLGRMLNKKVYM